MARAVPKAVGGARIIMGGTSQDERTRIVDDFQSGKVPVLVGSITAAGVGITLTRSSDALFVETDWTPAQVQQAEQRCVLEGQHVQTESGQVPIEKVDIGDRVLTHLGNWRQVTDKWNSRADVGGRGGRRHRKVLAEVSYVGTRDPLVVTHDHEVYVRRATGAVGWVEASAILPGDMVYTPGMNERRGAAEIRFPDQHRRWSLEEIEAASTCSECGGKPVISRGRCNPHYRAHLASGRALALEKEGRRPNGRYIPAPTEVKLDADFMALCGWYVAEGFAGIHNGRGFCRSFALHRDEHSVADWITDYMKRTFGLNSSIDSASENGIEVRSYGNDVVQWFHSEFGHGARNKRLPAWLMSLDDWQLESFLAAYILGDGYERRRADLPHRSWTTSSRTLEDQVGLIATSLGHRFLRQTIPEREVRAFPGGRRAPAAEHYVGSFTDGASGTKSGSWRAVRSTRLRLARRGEVVWDLSVEEDESFVVDMVAVHNCHRLGSTRTAVLRTMVAPGTMDERVQQVLAAKGRLLQPLMGKGQDVSVVEFEDGGSMAPAQIIADIAHGIMARRQRGTRRRAA